MIKPQEISFRDGKYTANCSGHGACWIKVGCARNTLNHWEDNLDTICKEHDDGHEDENITLNEYRKFQQYLLDVRNWWDWHCAQPVKKDFKLPINEIVNIEYDSNPKPRAEFKFGEFYMVSGKGLHLHLGDNFFRCETNEFEEYNVFGFECDKTPCTVQVEALSKIDNRPLKRLEDIKVGMFLRENDDKATRLVTEISGDRFNYIRFGDNGIINSTSITTNSLQKYWSLYLYKVKITPVVVVKEVIRDLDIPEIEYTPTPRVLLTECKQGDIIELASGSICVYLGGSDYEVMYLYGGVNQLNINVEQRYAKKLNVACQVINKVDERPLRWAEVKPGMVIDNLDGSGKMLILKKNSNELSAMNTNCFRTGTLSEDDFNRTKRYLWKVKFVNK